MSYLKLLRSAERGPVFLLAHWLTISHCTITVYYYGPKLLSIKYTYIFLNNN